MWLHQLLVEVDIKTSVPTKLWCDNQVALHIASNPVSCILIEKEIKRQGKAARIVKCSTGDCTARLLLYRKRVTIGVY